MSPNIIQTGFQLSEILWAHPKIFSAYVSCLVYGLKIDETKFDSFSTGIELYDGDLEKISDRHYAASWIVSIRVSDDTSHDDFCRFIIEGNKGTYIDPFRECDRYYSETEIQDGQWKLWDHQIISPANIAWKMAYRQTLDLLRAGDLVAFGQFQTVISDFIEIPLHVWPDDANSPNIDYESSRLRANSGEQFFYIQLRAKRSDKPQSTKKSQSGFTPKEYLVVLALEALGWKHERPNHLTACTRNASIIRWLKENGHDTVSDNLIIRVLKKIR